MQQISYALNEKKKSTDGSVQLKLVNIHIKHGINECYKRMYERTIEIDIHFTYTSHAVKYRTKKKLV